MDPVYVKNLTKIYGDTVALKGVSFSVNRGEIYCLVGPNGAGKTTTFRILSTLILPTSGEAYIEGYSVVDEPERVREIISYLPEDVGTYKNLTGYEYLKFVASIYFRDHGSVLDAIKRGKEISDLTEEELNKPMKTYSKGMKRRIQIARALMVRPKIAILDEPGSGLDPVQKHYIRKIIRLYAKSEGTTVLMSTHEMAEAEEICDRVAILYRGEIVARGTPKEIIDRLGESSLEKAFIKIVSSRSDEI